MQNQRIKAEQCLSEYARKNWKIDADTEFTVDWIDPRQLLCPDRLDLICKLYYIECREKGLNSEYAKELYIEHIKAFSGGTFTEPGSVHKNSIGKYFEDFDSLIDDIKANGLDATKSVVPVNSSNVILDGAHRTAIAIYYNLLLPVVPLDRIECHYDDSFFRKQGLSDKYLDFMAYRYLCQAKNIYVVCLWPKASDEELREKAEEFIRKYASIVYRKKIRLNYHGIAHLMIHLYGEQSWSGTIDNGFKGIDEKASNCFQDNADTCIYLIENCTLEQVVELKDKIRQLFMIENHSVHITDTHQEAVDAAQILLNDNSLDLLKYGDPLKNKEFLKAILELKEKQNVSGDYIVAETMPALYGMSVQNRPSLRACDSIEGYVDNPDNYLYYMGMKFVSLKFLSKLYESDRRLKDLEKIQKSINKKKKRESQGASEQSDTRKKISTGRYLYRKLLAFYRHKRYGLAKTNPKDIQDLEMIFWNLDDHCSYLIMRNWEGFYDDILIKGHNDIDVLCGDTFSRDMIVRALGAKPVTYDGFHYSFQYRGRDITLDTRIAGDGYYDKNWQLNMLESRKRHPLGFYIMDSENYLYSLAYHAIYQKKNGLSVEYLNRIRQMDPLGTYESQSDLISKLQKFMKQNRYFYTMTEDESVVNMFSRVPDQKRIRYPLGIRFRQCRRAFAEKDYKTRLKIHIRRLIKG